MTIGARTVSSTGLSRANLVQPFDEELHSNCEHWDTDKEAPVSSGHKRNFRWMS